MRIHYFSRLVLAICLLSGGILRSAVAQAPNRVTEHVDDADRFALPASLHPKTAIATDLGAASPDLQLPVITVRFAMSSAQQKALNALLDAQRDRSSPQYRKWLTPEQFGQQFGASQHDVSKVQQWLEDKGFSRVQVAHGRMFLTASGTAAQAEAAFQTPIHRYQLGSEQHFANSQPATLPRAFENLVARVTGLNDFRPKPRAVRARPRLTSDQTGNHFVAPADFATIYDLNALYSAGINGTGVTIAVAGQTDIDVTNVTTFRGLAGLPVNNPTINNLTGHAVSTADQGEAYLDVEWSGAVAPNATIFYDNGDNVEDAEIDIIDNANSYHASIMSTSYGLCEAQDDGGMNGTQIASDDQLFQQANAEGVTVMAPSGDDGAADCDAPNTPTGTTPTAATQGLAVDFPASSPYVTGVGGTLFSEGTGNYWATTSNAVGESALSYIPEVAWNEEALNGNISGASGGGASKYFPKPTWQIGTGVPSDGARDVPDVALNAALYHDGTIICTGTTNGVTDCVGTGTNGDGFRASDGTFDTVGGTSIATPSFAGIVALLIQKNGVQGNINPGLYGLAETSTDVFHDITSGNNEVPCKAGTPNCPASLVMGYVATAGYDQVTGLGSVDAAHLVNEWEPDFTMGLSPTSLSLAAGASGTSTLNLNAVDGYTGAVALTCAVSAALTSTTCSFSSSSVNVGSSATVTIMNGNSAHILPWHSPMSGKPWPWLMLAALGALLAAWPRSSKRILKGAVATACFAMALACGGGSSSGGGSTTPPPPVAVTGSVTITGVSGTLKHTVTLTVTDQ